MSQQAHGKPNVHAPDLAWLSQYQEPPIDPGLKVIESHHHLWDFFTPPYFAADYVADLKTGHNVIGSVFVECTMAYLTDGPVELRSVGETAFAAQQAEDQAAVDQPICNGIVGLVDLELGERLEAVLDRHVAAGKGRFRGVRSRVAYDADPEAGYGPGGTPAGIMARPAFRDGVRRLSSRGLTLDIWAFHTQLLEVAALADACPDARIVLDHVGGPLGVGKYRGQRQEVFKAWAPAIKELGRRENVFVKVGGLGLGRSGFDLNKAPKPPSSDDLVRVWGPYIDVCIDAFGPSRCMFGSNFPPDKVSCSFPILLNAFKKMTAACSQGEREQIFAKTANAFYQLGFRV